HGADGLDELTTTGPTFVASLENETIEEFEITPEDAGLPFAKAEDLVGGEPSENAAALRALLDGEKSAYRDIAVLNAAAALLVTGKADTLASAAHLAKTAIDSGAAKAALAKLAELSNQTLE
ncbi:MAG: anthranilate phosphoribosyltransferase, partial [Pseudomonadota bacterium]